MKKFFWNQAGSTFLTMLIIIGTSCSTRYTLDAKSVWLSSSSTPEQKVRAAKTLLPKGASLDEVRNILGADGVFARYASRDYYVQYPVSGGFVAVRLNENNIGNGFHTYSYNYVVYIMKLKSVSPSILTNTNS